MSEPIIVALISLIGSLGGTFSGVIVGSKLLTYRVDQLEKKVDKHNNVIERVYKLEREQAVTEEKIDVANHRLDDLEHKAEVI